jgi:hypothetical protein
MNTNSSNGVECVLDIETLGTNAKAPIISIGAILFDPRQTNTFAQLRERAYYAGVNIENAVDVCGAENISGGTITWWLQQSEAAIKRLVTGDTLSLDRALSGLWRYTHARVDSQPEWLRKMPVPTRVWAKSPSFDMTIIRSACEKLKILVPFHFSSERDVRTSEELAWPDGDIPKFNEGVAHDAADDAVAQALSVQATYQRLGMSYDNVRFR